MCPWPRPRCAQVADEIRERWPSVEGIAIVQRIGPLDPGTPTVLIACSAGHRDTGVFEAARYGIDRLKEIVPVWKKEIGPNGEEWVEGHYTPDDADRAAEQANPSTGSGAQRATVPFAAVFKCTNCGRHHGRELWPGGPARCAVGCWI